MIEQVVERVDHDGTPLVALTEREATRAADELLARWVETMAELSDAERAAAWAEVEEAFRRFEGGDGIVLPIGWLIGVGTK